MFDHVTIRVPDRAESERFFDAVFVPLGIDMTYRTRSFTEWHEFMLTEAADDHAVTRGLHVAFAAPSREQVDAFWRAGVQAGHLDDGPPGPRPQYGEDHYGAFLRDPSGNSVEAVHHGTRSQSHGIIDHLWLRVGNLAASGGFYRIAGAAAGFAVRHDEPERTTFAAPRSKGSLSLVPGAPTENLHIAFAGDDDAVRRFYEEAIAAGRRGNGEPRERPQYHPGYFAAYVLDPDGNNIEMVNHHRT